MWTIPFFQVCFCVPSDLQQGSFPALLYLHLFLLVLLPHSSSVFPRYSTVDAFHFSILTDQNGVSLQGDSGPASACGGLERLHLDRWRDAVRTPHHEHHSHPDRMCEVQSTAHLCISILIIPSELLNGAHVPFEHRLKLFMSSKPLSAEAFLGEPLTGNIVCLHPPERIIL
jgi:hypothetical protein